VVLRRGGPVVLRRAGFGDAPKDWCFAHRESEFGAVVHRFHFAYLSSKTVFKNGDNCHRFFGADVENA